MVDHESKDGKARLHLMLVHYQLVHGASKVIMPMVLIQKRMAPDNAVNIVSQSIATTYHPQPWMGRSVYSVVTGTKSTLPAQFGSTRSGNRRRYLYIYIYLIHLDLRY